MDRRVESQHAYCHVEGAIALLALLSALGRLCRRRRRRRSHTNVCHFSVIVFIVNVIVVVGVVIVAVVISKRIISLRIVANVNVNAAVDVASVDTRRIFDGTALTTPSTTGRASVASVTVTAPREDG